MPSNAERHKRFPMMHTFVEASVYGAIRGVTGLPLEHPFETVKTRWQADPQKFSCTMEVMKQIYKEAGFKGFFVGLMPNGTRLVVKQSYRWPMMLFLPPFYHRICSPFSPHLSSKSYIAVALEPSQMIPKVLSGATIGVIEAVIVCPLERLKVLSMTPSHPSTQLSNLPLQMVAAELFRGFGATLLRQVMNWTTFLATDQFCRAYAKQMNGDPEGNLPFKCLIMAGFVVGSVNTFICMPLDVVKTQMQKHSPLEEKKVSQAMRYILKNYGIKGLYTGWQVRMIQYFIQSAMTVTMLDRLETSLKKKLPS